MRKLARNLFLIGLVFHLIAAWFTVGYHTADEYYQIVEFASYKLGITPATDLAWEFAKGVRPALQPAMVYGLIKITGLRNPVTISFLLRLLSAITAWIVSFSFVLVSIRECKTEKAKRIILYLSTLLWFIPYIHSRFSSENWSSIFFFGGLSILALILRASNEKPRYLSLLLCGILLGLAYDTRFQSAIMIMGLGLWLLVFRKLDIKQLFTLFIGLALSIFSGILIDRWFYGQWTFAAFNYYRVNIMEHITIEWGTSPWWDYFNMIFDNLIPPFSIFILACIFIFFFRLRKHVLTWICIPFLLIHIFIGHKESRFLFPLVTALPVIIGLALDEQTIPARFKKFTLFLNSKFAMIGAKIFIIINILLMIATCVKPANEMFSFYNYMYENYNDKPTVLYTFSIDPYHNRPIKIFKSTSLDFFLPANLTVDSVSKDSLSQHVTFKDGEENLVFEEGLETDNSWHPLNKKVTMVYQNIPGWIMKLNFNGWLKHSRIWRVYKIE